MCIKLSYAKKITCSWFKNSESKLSVTILKIVYFCKMYLNSNILNTNYENRQLFNV